MPAAEQHQDSHAAANDAETMKELLGDCDSEHGVNNADENEAEENSNENVEEAEENENVAEAEENVEETPSFAVLTEL